MKEEISQVAIGRSIGVLVLKGLNYKFTTKTRKQATYFSRTAPKPRKKISRSHMSYIDLPANKETAKSYLQSISA